MSSPRYLHAALGIGLGVAALLTVSDNKRASAAEAATSAYLKGYKDFLSGIVPPEPGVYLRDDTIYYSGNISRTEIGGRVVADLNQWFVANVIVPTVVTSATVLGGTFGLGLTIPILGLDVHAGIDTGRFSRSRSDSALNIGDIYVTPVILGWHAGNFWWNAALSIVTPTGQYHQSALANTGLNYWSVLPQLSVTYFEPKSGWDVSAALAYVVNTENTATDYQTGNIFHLDWAVGKQLTPAWKIGVVGYLLEQVTGDSGSGAILGSNKMSVWSLGPAATYGFKVGKTPVSILAKWTHEIAASRTFQGDTVTAAFSLKF